MTSQGRSNRERGKRWEQDLVNWWKEHGWPWAERAPIGRAGGDVLGVPGLHIEAKNVKTLDLAGHITQATTAARPDDLPVVIVKRRQKPTHEAYAVMRLDHFTHLWNTARNGDQQ